MAIVLSVRFKQTFTTRATATAEAHSTVAMSKANGYGVQHSRGKRKIKDWLVGGPLEKKKNAQDKGSGHMTRR